MCRLMLSILFAAVFLMDLQADDCAEIRAEFKVPVELKTRGRPRVARWEKVDQILTGLGQRTGRLECRFTFAELFRNKKEEELYFPLTNTVLRVVPEGSLLGVQVFSKEGESLGVFANRVRYERSGGLHVKESYASFYFQYTDRADKLQSVGHRLLLDDFVVRWMDIKDKVAVAGE